MRTALKLRVCLAACLAACGGGSAPIEDYGAVSEWALTDQDGRPFGSTQLRGKPYVVTFVFTSCPGVCPTITSTVRNLQTRLRERELDARLVTITVDPDHDTPEVLKAYARRYAADHASWTFVTGEREAIHRLIVREFKQALGDREPTGADPSVYDIMHSMKLVLVDGRGHIRGFYDMDADSLARLLDALQALGAS